MFLFSLSAYVTCARNSFWSVAMVNLVDIAAGDVINIDFIHSHEPSKKKISTPTTSTGKSCIYQTSAIINFYTQ